MTRERRTDRAGTSRPRCPEDVDGREGPGNSGRLCVKGRFGFDYVNHPHRLTTPLIRRADGYHELDSLVVFADCGDTLEARVADTLSLSVLGPMAVDASLSMSRFSGPCEPR